ncbi:MAG: apolipoprotein N-acyltransferase [Leptospira sp.]|nr:apolipoprotein N-acyltransferase [Leptospira sp.]NCS94940.1 apolipoprotein N-acyltransferase [Leptospira sp.]
MKLKDWIVVIFCSLWVALFSNYAFAPTSQSYLVWFAPWGLFYLERRYRAEYKKLFWIGCLLAIVFYSVSFQWILHMTVTFGGFPLFLALPIFFLSAVFLNLWFPFFLVGFSFLVTKLRREFAFIAGFVALLGEFATPQIFPWYWGSIVAGNIFLAQTAEYMSIYGLTFFLFIGSYLSFTLIGRDIFNFLLSLPKMPKIHWSRISSLKFFGRELLVISLFWIVGFSLYWKWNQVKPTDWVDTLVIQPNAPLEFRDGRSVAETMLDLMTRIEQLTLEGAASSSDPVDLVVLPESGVPFFSAHKHSATISPPLYWERFDALMKIISNRLNANVFFNELDASYVDEKVRTRKNLRYYNSSTVYDPNGDRISSYQKVYLLAFGEYMPFEFLYDLSPQTGRFEPGKNLDFLPIYSKSSEADVKAEANEGIQNNDFKHLSFEQTANVKIEEVLEKYKTFRQTTVERARFLPLICYEVIIPEFVRTFKQSGNPDFIVNVTNDKWYGISAETYQHGDLGRIRSIEWRKWMVRSTNSGSSFFVDHLGRVVDNEFTGQESSEFIRKKVGVIKSEHTFYVRYGNSLVWSLLMILASYFSWIYWRTKRA